MADVDFAAEGLLDGLEGRAREEREELLDWLLEQGFTLAQLHTAVSPMWLPAGRAVGDDGTRISLREAAEDSGLDLEMHRRLGRAVGLSMPEDPDAKVLNGADTVAAKGAKMYLDLGMAPEQVLAVSRVLSHGLAQAAEVMRQSVLDAVLTAGASELELAKVYAALVDQLAPTLGPMVHELLLLQLRHSVETEEINAAERAAGTLPGARDVAVLFADLVGFTRLGEAVEPQRLEALASTLADLAREVSVTPVRFVKTIGDAVMLVSADAGALLSAGLELVARAEAEGEDFPQLRVGIAHGPAVSRAGDWFGAPVNLASRVTGVARPGSVLVAEPVRERIGDDAGIAWSFAGARRLKGVRDEVSLFRARVSVPNGQPEAPAPRSRRRRS